jgi:hypothetical protein
MGYQDGPPLPGHAPAEARSDRESRISRRQVTVPIKHLVLCRVEKRPPKLDLDLYPYLPRATVARTSAASYMCLVAGDAA